MELVEEYFWLLPVAMLAYFAWRYARAGSITGALLGGRLTSTVGELQIKSQFMGTQTFKVHILQTDPGDEPKVALAIVSRAPLSISLNPMKLTQAQARELATLLERAAAGQRTF